MNEYPIENFDATGIAMPLRVLPEATATTLAARVMDVRTNHGTEGETALRTAPHYLIPWMFEVAKNNHVLDAVEKVLGPDILIWSSEFFIKDAGDGRFVSWHQDATYWGLEPHNVVTAWIALSPSTPESGCMQVAPGTHKDDILPHQDTFGGDNLLSRGQEITVDVAKMDTVDVILKPGEMSLHHVKLVHGSAPNRADYPRLGYVVRYIPTSVRQTGGRTCAVLARGEDHYGHFDLVVPTGEELTQAAWEQANEAKARMTAIIMDSAEQESVHAIHQRG